MLASSMLLGSGMMLAGAASAAGSETTGAKAKLKPGVRFSETISYERDGHKYEVQGGILQLETEDEKILDTYCIDLLNPTQPSADYTETGWASSSLAGKPEEAGKILWILRNSFPQQSIEKLREATKIADLSQDDAAAGTQAAIWHFSDGVDAVPDDPQAKQLTEYLRQKAVKLEEPKPTLSLSPAAVSGKSGDLLGPITVTTNGASVSLALDEAGTKANLSITDKAGKAVKTAKNGDEIYAKSPAGANPGNATIKAGTSAEVSVGRAFTGVNAQGKHSQTLILAGSQPVPVTASVAVNWAPTGPIPAVSAKVDCVQGAVVVTAANNGDQDFTFTLSGQTVTVPPGGTKSVPVKVAEDTAYDIVVSGPNGFKQEFKGVLNCKTDTASSPTPKAPSASPSGPVLANTGGGGQTPLLAGIAGALVIGGAAAVFTLRRRGRHSRA
ncbi:Cys-Gln thioester bond-forming surface protein [Kitasatospora sp. NPDC101801]|uniref:Cys-Gln thioester bond-forming surface protein n=1 Tax=unclassified Kitasatospora TaxID=2633591 RepID=UPI00324F0085